MRKPAPATAAAPAALRAEIKVAAAIGAALLVLGIVFVITRAGASGGGAGQPGQYAFAVGNPGPGAQAPAIQLPSTSGGSFTLASQRGKTVLLYFQEGVTCEPCWNQLKDIEARQSDFKSLGVDAIVSITTDPLDTLQRKVADEHLTTPVLSDQRLAVSTAYSANSYGMMGNARDGHSFVVVGPTGRILWRADYGGAPDYTMYVPVPNLLADLRAGLGSAGPTRG